MVETPETNDPLTFINRLDADAIERRLHELIREQAALRVLLRSARARRRAENRRQRREVGDAR
jgi:hypothetical protein